MANGKKQLKFRSTRWIQLIFPQELVIDEAHVLTRKRHFPAFWILREESIPLSKVASIQITKGLFFSSVVIENSGGPFPIAIKGISNRKAQIIRRTLETHDLGLRSKSESENEQSPKTGDDEKKIRGLLNLIGKAKKRDESMDFEDDEPIDAWWQEPSDREQEDENEAWVSSGTQKQGSNLDTMSGESKEKSQSSSTWMNDLVRNPSKTNDINDDW